MSESSHKEPARFLISGEFIEHLLKKPGNMNKNGKLEMVKTTAYNLVRERKHTLKIMTGCRKLDEKLGGGIFLGYITEIGGGSGCGKTHFCLQFCINVQFPARLGGLSGKAIYIDTNQNFNPTRLEEMAQCMQDRLNTTYKRHVSIPFCQLDLLDNVAYYSCPNHIQLAATILCLDQQLSQDPLVKLIVIDSFAFPLRCIAQVGDRTRLMLDLLRQLKQMAYHRQVAVVITNEMTGRCKDNVWETVPCLGVTLTQNINCRITLTRDKPQEEEGVAGEGEVSGNHTRKYIRWALVGKDIAQPTECVRFGIKKKGVGRCGTDTGR